MFDMSDFATTFIVVLGVLFVGVILAATIGAAALWSLNQFGFLTPWAPTKAFALGVLIVLFSSTRKYA